MKIIAYLCVYNEEDILEENVLYHTAQQGVDIVVIDNGSTDATADIIKRLAGENRILDHVRYTTERFSLQQLTRAGFELARKHNPDWIIHLDASTFLESGSGSDVPLSEQIRKADEAGYNVISLASYDFYPTERDDPDESSVFKRMKFYANTIYTNRLQEKIFKNLDGLLTHNGHKIIFPKSAEKKISDKKAVMRHYIFRSAPHGVRKILERKNRWDAAERADNHHTHYDGFLGFEEEIPVPSRLLAFKDEEGGWDSSITYKEPPPLPTEKYDINRSHRFDRLPFRHSDCCFIVGCPGSGTSLLGHILEGNGSVICYGEPACYDYLSDAALPEEANKQKTENGVLAFESAGITEYLDSPDRATEYSRGRRFPPAFTYDGQPVLFLVRDPRDVYLYLTGLKSDPLQRDAAEAWEKYIDDLAAEAKARGADPGGGHLGNLSALKNAGKLSLAAKAALYWKIKTESFFRYDELGYNLHLVLYEDLCVSPEKNLEDICNFLKIPFDSQMLEHDSIKRDVGKGGVADDAHVRLIMDPGDAIKYRGNVPIEEQRTILSIAGPTYKKIQHKWIQQLGKPDKQADALEAAKSYLAARDERIQELQEDLDEKNVWALRLDEEAEIKDKKIRELQKELDEKSVWALRLDEEAEIKDKKIRELQKELDEKSVWALRLDEEAEIKDKKIRELQKELDEKSVWALRLDEEAEIKDKKIRELQKELDEKSVWALRLDEEAEIKDKKIRELQKELDEKSVWALRLDEEAEIKDKKIRELQKELDEKSVWALRLDEEAEIRDREAEIKDKKLGDLQRELDSTKKTIENKESEMADLLQKMHVQNDEFEEIRQSVLFKTASGLARKLDKLFPQNSKRGEMFRLSKALFDIVQNDGYGALLRAFREKWRSRSESPPPEDTSISYEKTRQHPDDASAADSAEQAEQ